jgi:hypothetical protein
VLAFFIVVYTLLCVGHSFVVAILCYLSHLHV